MDIKEFIQRYENSGADVYPDGKGLFTEGYELEFWSEVNQKRMRVVFPVSLFEDETDEGDDE